MNKTLFLLRGLPGSGKTTLAQTIADGLFAADDFFHDPETGAYNFDASKLGIAHRQCQDNCENAMQHGFRKIAVHNTFTTVKEMQPYYELAKLYGYVVHSLIVENRHGGQNVHSVPEAAMDRMERRFDISLRGAGL